MPKMSDLSSAPPVRGLIVGDSGTGKTGSLASLALAGYNLWIADFDNGMEILRNAIRTKNPEALARVDFETCRDEYTTAGPYAIPKSAKAWPKGLLFLEKAFKQKLGPKDIVVVDSLSFAAKAAMVYTLHLNNRLQAAPYQSDWGEAQRLVEGLVAMLCQDAECHVLCTAHIAQTGGKRIETLGKGKDAERVLIDEGPIKKLPSMIGKAINPIIPRYFNHMLQTYRIGSGNNAKYSLRTQATDDLELKNTSPGIIRPEYSIASGLADYFKDAMGAEPQVKAA
jgi:hypothetical protein